MPAKSLQSCLTLCNPTDCSSSAPLSMEFHRQKYYSGFPCPPSGHLPNLGIKPTSLVSPAWQTGSLPSAPPGKSFWFCYWNSNTAFQTFLYKRHEILSKISSLHQDADAILLWACFGTTLCDCFVLLSNCMGWHFHYYAFHFNKRLQLTDSGNLESGKTEMLVLLVL